MSMLNNVWRALRRSPYQSLAAIFVMALMSFFVTALVLFTLSSQVVFQYFESRPRAIVYLKDDIEPAQVAEIKSSLEQTGKIATLQYLSKAEALSDWRKTFAKEPDMLDMVTEKLLPASLEFSTVRLEDLPQLSVSIKDKPGVEKIQFQEDVVNNLITTIRVIRLGGAALIALLALASILVIVMVIGLKITSRRDEIEVLQLVGASAWYIRRPFVLEGAAYAFFGAIVAVMVASFLVWAITPQLTSYLGAIQLTPLTPLPLFVTGLCEIAAAALLGAIGALLSVWRYLKL